MWEPVGNTEDGFSRNKVQNSYVRVLNIKNAKSTSRKNRKNQNTRCNQVVQKIRAKFGTLRREIKAEAT